MGINVRGEETVLSAIEAKGLIDSGKARLLGPSQIERVSNEEATAAGSLQTRGFKDNHPFPFGPWMQPSTPQFDQRVDYKTLRDIYRKSSAVRPCVSFLVRTLSTTPWNIIAHSGVPKRDLKFATEMFTDPGPSDKSFRELLARVLTDLFVLDSIYVEKIRATGGGIVEFAARDPATFQIIPGESGEILGYKHRRRTAEGTDNRVIEFDPEDILHTVFYPRTDSFMGTPVIEAILEEVTALILASTAIASFFDEDEIPTGILHLGDIGVEAYKRAQAEFEAKGGMRSKRLLRTTFGKGEPRWIPFRRPFREMEIAELMPRLERIVFRNFGVTPLDLGMSQDVNRSTAEAFKEIRTFTLFKPILDLLAESFTFDILHEINTGLFLEFQHFSRTGEDSDEGAGLGTKGTPVDSDVPGEEEGARSPLFGGYGLREAGFSPIMCRPHMVMGQGEREFTHASWTDDQIVNLLADENVQAIVGDATRTSNVLVETLLTEAAEEFYDMVNSKATRAEIRTQAEYVRDVIAGQVQNNLRAVEAEAHEYVSRVVGETYRYSSIADSLLIQYTRKLDELVVSQISSTSIGADEEASMISAFDSDKLSVDSMVIKVAANCFRSALSR